MLQSYHGSSEGGREDAAVQRHVKTLVPKNTWELLGRWKREKKAEAVSSFELVLKSTWGCMTRLCAFHSKNEDRSKQENIVCRTRQGQARDWKQRGREGGRCSSGAIMEAAREGGRTLQFKGRKNAWCSNVEVARQGGFVQLKVRHQVLATVGGDSYP